MKLVRIDWIDSVVSTSRWQYIEEAKSGNRPSRCRSVGWIIYEDKAGVTLSPNLGSTSKKDPMSDQACGVITIPKVAITKRRSLS